MCVFKYVCVRLCEHMYVYLTILGLFPLPLSEQAAVDDSQAHGIIKVRKRFPR